MLTEGCQQSTLPLSPEGRYREADAVQGGSLEGLGHGGGQHGCSLDARGDQERDS